MPLLWQNGSHKENCFNFINLQGNAKYVKTKASHPARIQACIDILEDAAGMSKYEHCFQYNCNGETCYFPPEKHQDMLKPSVLFFNSDMHGTCVQSKQHKAHYDPQYNSGWYDDNPCHRDRG